eukprot:GHVP01025040.1.p1 GENE.GHVP01025040.1~~GHVP01025040.1.p1  ORF type:complete len:442 (+),score=91.66 GHVP01025040.1:131-1456(+)
MLLSVARDLKIKILTQKLTGIDIGGEDGFSKEEMMEKENLIEEFVKLIRNLKKSSTSVTPLTLAEWEDVLTKKKKEEKLVAKEKKKEETGDSPDVSDEEIDGIQISFPPNVLQQWLEYIRILYQGGYFKFAFKNLALGNDIMAFVVEAKQPEFVIPFYWATLSSAIGIACSEDSESWPSDETAQFSEIGSIFIKLETVLSEKKIYTEQSVLQRLWLLHWTVLWVLKYYLSQLTTRIKTANRTHLLGEVLEFLFAERNTSLIVRFAPHLLKYLSVIGIVFHKRPDLARSLQDCLQHRRFHGSFEDPFSEFVEAARIKCDFDTAQIKLQELCAEASEDFLLHNMATVIEEESRMYFFETYCRTHKTIDMKMIAESLGMTNAEEWIIDLIRRTKLNARIDSELDRVEISSEAPSMQESIWERTKAAEARLELLMNQGHTRQPKM